MGPCNKQDIPAACSWEMKTGALAVSTVGTSGILICSHFSYTLYMLAYTRCASKSCLVSCITCLHVCITIFFSTDCRFVMCSEQSYVLKSHCAHSLVLCYLSVQLRKLRSVRPVPFRILDLSSVPFRSAPFREIATTPLKQSQSISFLKIFLGEHVPRPPKSCMLREHFQTIF